MQRLPLLSTLAGGALLLGAAGSAKAQSCFECVQESGSNPDRPNLYCTGGYDYGACTTQWEQDPNTCEYYSACMNVYSCASWQDPDTSCTNSSCDPNQRWDFYTYYDMYDYMCYHYGTFCGSSHFAE